jgi:hypothetical protein
MAAISITAFLMSENKTTTSVCLYISNHYVDADKTIFSTHKMTDIITDKIILNRHSITGVALSVFMAATGFALT